MCLCVFVFVCVCVCVCAGAMSILPLVINQPTHQPTHQPSVPISHSHTQRCSKDVSCGSLWGLSPFCRVHSIDVSSHRFRPSDHMCVNERSMVATISGGNNQWRRSLLCLDGCSLHAMTMLCYVCSQGSFPCCCFSFSIKMCVGCACVGCVFVLQ